MDQWLSLYASSARGSGLIPGQELRSHMGNNHELRLVLGGRVHERFCVCFPMSCLVVNLTRDWEVPTGTKPAWPLGGDEGSWKLRAGCRGFLQTRRWGRENKPAWGSKKTFTREFTRRTVGSWISWAWFCFFAPASFLTEPYFGPSPRQPSKEEQFYHPWTDCSVNS